MMVKIRLWIFICIILSLKSIGLCYEFSTISTTMSSNQIDDESSITIKLKSTCESHTNCSYKIFSLDTYCCDSIGYCCNWFEFVTNFHIHKSSLPYKPPSILTIITLLILFICVLFISYCFCILFCYCFKCGLFKRPKLVVVSELSPSHLTSNNIAGDSLSAAQIIMSPKNHSSQSSCSSTSSSSSSLSYTNNRLNPKQNKRKPTQSMQKYNSTSCQQPNRTKRISQISRSNSEYNKKRNIRSPTARATCAASSSNNASSSRHRNQLYAEPECYIDYDNDSPFLIPPQASSNNNKPALVRGQFRSTTTEERQRSRHSRQASEPASSTHRNRSYQQNYQNQVQKNTSNQRLPGTAVALIDNDFITGNRLETVNDTGSSNASRTSSSLSLEFGASLIHNNQTDLIASNLGQQLNSNSLMSLTRSSNNLLPSAPSYYQDEKPPAYDDIIGKNL